MQENVNVQVLLWSSKPGLGLYLCALLPAVLQKLIPQLVVQVKTAVESVKLWCEETQKVFANTVVQKKNKLLL